MKYVRNIEFGIRPDYQKLLDLIKQCMEKNDINYNDT